ncbi:MAG: alanine racemase [Desulfobacterales bacterium]|nr:alanine racemase [Desulfobacterales bacterium]
MTSFALNRVEIDLAALAANYAVVRETVGSGVRVMAVVKADAYGHGMVRVARTLAAAGARTFGVAEVEEGMALRGAGVPGEIVVLLGGPLESVAEMVGNQLTPVVFDIDTLAELSQRARALDAVLDVHLKVDVGMGRLGIMPAEVQGFVRQLTALPGLRLTGVLSHLPAADDPAADQNTSTQLRCFQEVLAGLEQKNGVGPVTHIANSAALLYHQPARLDMVRPGISLYGYYPDGAAGIGAATVKLRPVMRFKTRVLQVKEVPAGAGISYGHTFVTRRPTRLAVLPVGYDDGYLRRLSNRAQVLIHGQRAPVRGRVCMNACMVDITDLDDAAAVRPGDEVVLIGPQGGELISADELAGWLETISYEVLCLIGSRNQRFYSEKSEFTAENIFVF